MKNLADYLGRVEVLDLDGYLTGNFGVMGDAEENDDIALDITCISPWLEKREYYFTVLEVNEAEYVPETGEWNIGGNDTKEPHSLTIYSLTTLGNDDE